MLGRSDEIRLAAWLKWFLRWYVLIYSLFVSGGFGQWVAMVPILGNCPACVTRFVSCDEKTSAEGLVSRWNGMPKGCWWQLPCYLIFFCPILLFDHYFLFYRSWPGFHLFPCKSWCAFLSRPVCGGWMLRYLSSLRHVGNAPVTAPTHYYFVYSS